MRVGVIGASIAGLATAIALRRIGADVVVFERRENLEDEGAALALRPEAIAGLARLGISIPGASIDGWRYAYVDKDTPRVRVKSASPLVAYTYASLRKALHEAARDINIRLGTRVASVATQGDHAAVRLESGESVTFDLVVAADGVDSTARQQLLPEAGPKSTGILMGRGFAHEPDVRGLFDPGMLPQLLNVNTQFFSQSRLGWWLCFLIPERTPGAGQRFGWVSYLRVSQDDITALLTEEDGTRREWGTRPGRTSAKARAHMSKIFEAEFPGPLPIARLVEHGVVTFQQVTRMATEPMFVGRVAILGDAAHVVPPFTTAGTSLAIGDAVTLAEHLRSGVTTAALERWSAERVNAARAILAIGDRIVEATIDQPPDLANADESTLRAWAARLLPPGAEANLVVYPAVGAPAVRDV